MVLSSVTTVSETRPRPSTTAKGLLPCVVDVGREAKVLDDGDGEMVNVVVAGLLTLTMTLLVLPSVRVR